MNAKGYCFRSVVPAHGFTLLDGVNRDGYDRPDVFQ